MASLSGYMPLMIVGGNTPNQIHLKKDYPFYPIKESIVSFGDADNDFWGRSLDLSQHFEKAFFDWSESGVNPTYISKTSSASGTKSAANDIEWYNYHIDGQITRGSLAAHEQSYWNAIKAKPGGYVDLGKTMSLENNFGLYFRLLFDCNNNENYSGVIFSRGVSGGGDEFNVYITKNGSSEPQIVVDYVDVYGNDQTISQDLSQLYQGSDKYFTGAIALDYSGNTSSGEFVISQFFFRRNTTEANRTSTGYVSPRKKLANSENRLLGPVNSAPNYVAFSGYLGDFIATSGRILDSYSQSTKIGRLANYYAGLSYNSQGYGFIQPSAVLGGTDEISQDNNYVEKVVYNNKYSSDITGSHIVNLNTLNDISTRILSNNEKPYQIVGPYKQYNNLLGQDVTYAPSSAYIEVVYEHNTNHPSGIRLQGTISANDSSNNYYGFSTPYHYLPSGEKQSVRMYPDETTAYDDLITILKKDFDLFYLRLDSNYLQTDQEYYGEFKIYSSTFKCDVWSIADTGVSGLSLYTTGTYPKETADLTLMLLNQQLNNSLDLFTHGYTDFNDNLTLYTESYLTENSGITLYTDGLTYKYDSIPLYTTTKLPVSSSGNMSLYTWGTNVTAIRNVTNLVVKGPTFDRTWSIPLYVSGPAYAEQTNNIPLYMYNDNTYNNTLALFMLGPSGINDNLNLMIKGPVGGGTGSDGWFPKNNNIPLYLQQRQGTSENLELFLKSYQESSSSTNMFTTGVFKMPASSSGGESVAIVDNADDVHYIGSLTFQDVTLLEVGDNDGDATYSSLRFLTNIPAGATISSATLDLTAQSADSDDTNLRIRVVETVGASQATDATEFNTLIANATTNGEGAVAWDLPSQSLDEVLSSPDFSSVLQRLVDLPGFDGTVIVLLDGGESFVDAERRFYSHNSDPNKAPILNISWADTTSMNLYINGVEQITKSTEFYTRGF